MLLGIFFWLFMAAEAQDVNHEMVVTPSDIVIFVDQDSSSDRLSKIVSTYARLHRSMVKQTITNSVAPSVFDGKIKVYDQTNIKHLSKNECNYNVDAVKCGIENNHWTITPSIAIEELHANFNLSLFDENGNEIATSSVPIWGFVQLLPQYRKTTIKENSMFGQTQKEILEQFPPKRKKIPPLITSKHVSDAIMMLFLSIEVENI